MILPLELLYLILDEILDRWRILNLREVNRTFSHYLTPRAFRTVRFTNTVRSALALNQIQRSRTLAMMVKEVVFVYTDEGLVSAPLVGETNAALNDAISMLGSLPSLESLAFNFHPKWAEPPPSIMSPSKRSKHLSLQLSILESVANAHADMPLRALKKLTLSNLISFSFATYHLPELRFLLATLPKLELRVISNVDGGKTPLAVALFAHFWSQTMTKLLQPCEGRLSSLTLHSDILVASSSSNDVPSNLHTLNFPHLVALSLRNLAFGSSKPGEVGVEKFILRHGATLTSLELDECPMCLVTNEGLTEVATEVHAGLATNEQWWANIWEEFEGGLPNLQSLRVSHGYDVVKGNLGRIPRKGYVHLTALAGYVQAYPEDIDGEDATALASLNAVIFARRQGC